MTLKEDLVQALIHYDMHAVTRSYEAQAALLLDLLAKREIGDAEAVEIMASAIHTGRDTTKQRKAERAYRALQQRAMIMGKV